MDQIREFISANPILAASLSSVWGAVLVDLIAFKNTKEPGSFFGQFSFRIAAWRYLQAFVGGFIGNAAVVGAASLAGAAVALALWSW